MHVSVIEQIALSMGFKISYGHCTKVIDSKKYGFLDGHDRFEKWLKSPVGRDAIREFFNNKTGENEQFQEILIKPSILNLNVFLDKESFYVIFVAQIKDKLPIEEKCRILSIGVGISISDAYFKAIESYVDTHECNNINIWTNKHISSFVSPEDVIDWVKKNKPELLK